MNLSKERLEELIRDFGYWSAATRRDDDPEILAALRELLSLRSQNEWVKCSERLPEEGKYMAMVVVHNCLGNPMGRNHCIVYYYCKADPKGWRDEQYEMVDPTHWRPLPAAPEEV